MTVKDMYIIPDYVNNLRDLNKKCQLPKKTISIDFNYNGFLLLNMTSLQVVNKS
jgi:hypothetical protein